MPTDRKHMNTSVSRYCKVSVRRLLKPHISIAKSVYMYRSCNGFGISRTKGLIQAFSVIFTIIFFIIAFIQSFHISTCKNYAYLAVLGYPEHPRFPTEYPIRRTVIRPLYQFLSRFGDLILWLAVAPLY